MINQKQVKLKKLPSLNNTETISLKQKFFGSLFDFLTIFANVITEQNCSSLSQQIANLHSRNPIPLVTVMINMYSKCEIVRTVLERILYG